MSKHLPILGIILAISIVAVIGLTRSRTITSTNKIKIAGSFYLLAHLAEQVGGDKVQVSTITPSGSEPHDFEPTPQDIVTIQSSALFIINGSGLDPWAEKVATDLPAKGIEVLKMSENIELLNTEEPEDHQEEEEANHEESTDPHFWLDPVLAQKQIELIAAKLSQIDSHNTEHYKQRAASYSAKLQELDTNYKNSLANCTKREIITSHAAFGYLAKRYNITVHSISGLSPEIEPSAKELVELTQLAKEKDIRYIFFETLVSPKLAETLAREVGAQTLVFNPIEGLTAEELKAGSTYLSIMEENLENLKLALDCQ